MSKTKIHGVVYTPEPIVDLILDSAFRGQPILGRRVCDPSCGDGAFLVRVVHRALDEAKAAGWSAPKTKKALSLITGLDLDEEAIEECRGRLDDVAAQFGIRRVSWDLRAGDSLERDSSRLADLYGAVDFVVGNPPYVRIQNFGEERRERIRREWPTCANGSTDLYIAFFEFGVQLLRPDGRLAYITPRAYFTAHAGKDLRAWIVGHRLLSGVIDFGTTQIFEDVTTYCAITVLERAGADIVSVERRTSASDVVFHETCSRDAFAPAGSRWVTTSESTRTMVVKAETGGIPLGRVAEIRVGLATLADKVYSGRVLEGSILDDDEVVLDLRGDRVAVESWIVRPLVKASRLSRDDENQGLGIIFPYELTSGSAKLVSPEALESRAPKAFAYLSSHREELEGRGHDTREFYAYGSTQGLTTSFGTKILVPPMSAQGAMYLWHDEVSTFYSGYCIKFQGDLAALRARLSQPDFVEYVRAVGREYRGGYFSMTKKVMERFSLPAEEWENIGWVPHDEYGQVAINF